MTFHRDQNLIEKNWNEILYVLTHTGQNTYVVYISFLFIPWNCPYCRFFWWNMELSNSNFLQNYGKNLLNFLPYC